MFPSPREHQGVLPFNRSFETYNGLSLHYYIGPQLAFHRTHSPLPLCSTATSLTTLRAFVAFAPFPSWSPASAAALVTYSTAVSLSDKHPATCNSSTGCTPSLSSVPSRFVQYRFFETMVLRRPLPVVFYSILKTWFARERLSPSMVNDALNHPVEFLPDLRVFPSANA